MLDVSPPFVTAPFQSTVEELLHLMTALSGVTHQPAAARTVSNLTACRALELLEVYFRRALELTVPLAPRAWLAMSNLKFTALEAATLGEAEVLERILAGEVPKLADKLQKCREALRTVLLHDPLTDAQVSTLFTFQLKRNLLTHNAGRVDQKYLEALPPGHGLRVGDHVDFGDGSGAQAVLACLSLIFGLDTQLVRRFPELGTVPAHEVAAAMAHQMNEAYQRIQVSDAEQSHLSALLEGLFRLPAVQQFRAAAPPPIFGPYQTAWVVLPHAEGECALQSLDGRVVLPFQEVQDAQAWLSRSVDWAGAVLEELDEQWGFVRLADQRALKWPVGELPDHFIPAKVEGGHR